MIVRGIQFACAVTFKHVHPAQPAGPGWINPLTWTLAEVCPSQKGCDSAAIAPLVFLGTGIQQSFLVVISRICGCSDQLGFSTISQVSITDTLWRAVDFHRSGRQGLSQKTAFIRRGLAEGKFSNYYPYILDSSIFNGQRATLRPNVTGDLEKAWEVSSSSAEEAEEEHESL